MAAPRSIAQGLSTLTTGTLLSADEVVTEASSLRRRLVVGAQQLRKEHAPAVAGGDAAIGWDLLLADSEHYNSVPDYLRKKSQVCERQRA